MKRRRIAPLSLFLCLTLVPISIQAQTSINRVLSVELERGSLATLVDSRADVASKRMDGRFPVPSIRIDDFHGVADRNASDAPFVQEAMFVDLINGSLPLGPLDLKPTNHVSFGDARLFGSAEPNKLADFLDLDTRSVSDGIAWSCWVPSNSLVVVDNLGTHRESQRGISSTLTKDRSFRVDYLPDGKLAALTDGADGSSNVMVWDADDNLIYSAAAPHGFSWGQMGFLNGGSEVLVEKLIREEKPTGGFDEHYYETVIIDLKSGNSRISDLKIGGFRSFDGARVRTSVLSENRETLALIDYSNPRTAKSLWRYDVQEQGSDAPLLVVDAAVSEDGALVAAVLLFENAAGQKYELCVFDDAGKMLTSQPVHAARGLQFYESRWVVYGAPGQRPPLQPQFGKTGQVSIYEIQQ